MALVKFNNWASASGSVNGTTYSRNASGAYARNRTVPVNPNTTNQQTIRGAVNAATIAWSSTLTQAQRDAWTAYANATSVVNSLGDTILLKGNNWYVAAGSFRLFTGDLLSNAADAPPTGGLAVGQVIGGINIDAAGGDVEITFNAGQPDLSTVGRLRMWYSNVVSAGTKFYAGPWHFADVAPTIVGQVATFAAAMPAGTAGQRFFVRTRYITSTNRLSAPLISGPYTSA